MPNTNPNPTPADAPSDERRSGGERRAQPPSGGTALSAALGAAAGTAAGTAAGLQGIQNRFLSNLIQSGFGSAFLLFAFWMYRDFAAEMRQSRVDAREAQVFFHAEMKDQRAEARLQREDDRKRNEAILAEVRSLTAENRAMTAEVRMTRVAIERTVELITTGKSAQPKERSQPNEPDELDRPNIPDVPGVLEIAPPPHRAGPTSLPIHSPDGD